MNEKCIKFQTQFPRKSAGDFFLRRMLKLTDIGFVPKMGVFPLVGATNGEVFVADAPMRLCSKAICEYH